MQERQESIDTRTAGLWLLVIAAALFATEVGTEHVADSSLASAIGAVVAACASAGAVIAWRPPASLALTSAALCTAGAAAIHFAVTDQHFEEWWGFGLFFLASAWVQLLWATVVVRGRSTQLVAIGLAGNAAVVAIWIMSRTVGLPFGPEPGEAEALGWADAISTGFEITAVLGCIVVLARPVWEHRFRASPLLVAAATSALTVVALLQATSGGHHHH